MILNAFVTSREIFPWEACMLKDMITIERLVRGEATERVHHGGEFDLSRLTLDEI